jgi:hypothetical protein
MPDSEIKIEEAIENCMIFSTSYRSFGHGYRMDIRAHRVHGERNRELEKIRVNPWGWCASFIFFFVERGEALGWEVGQGDVVKDNGGRKERKQERMKRRHPIL